MPKSRIDEIQPEDNSLPENRPKITKGVRGPARERTIDSPLFSLKEAADYLGVSMRIVRKLIDANELKVIPLAGVIKIRRQTIDAWLESKEVYRDNEEAFSGSKRFVKRTGDGNETDEE